MKLLLEGSLNDTLIKNHPLLSMKDLLTGIFQAEAPGLSLLKLTHPSNKEQGEVYFLGGHYIVGAKLNNEITVTGLAALNHLLEFRQAYFVYYACDSLEALPQSQALKIDLKQMIDHWQDTKPVSEEQLLDKIFNVPSSTGTTGSGMPPLKPAGQTIEADKIKDNLDVVTSESRIESESEPITTPELNKAEDRDIDWDVVEPLLSSSTKSEAGSQTGWPTGTMWSSGNRDWFADTPDTQELKSSLSSDVSWQRKLRSLSIVLSIFLIAIIVVFCSAWLLMNMPSLHLAPRRFSLPILEKYGLNKGSKWQR